MIGVPLNRRRAPFREEALQVRVDGLVVGAHDVHRRPRSPRDGGGRLLERYQWLRAEAGERPCSGLWITVVVERGRGDRRLEGGGAVLPRDKTGSQVGAAAVVDVRRGGFLD